MCKCVTTPGRRECVNMKMGFYEEENRPGW